MCPARIIRIGLSLTVVTVTATFVWLCTQIGVWEAARDAAGMILALVMFGAFLSPFVIFFVGSLHRNARVAILRAADFARAQKYLDAEYAVQDAIRMNPALASHPDAVSLYRIIVATTAADQAVEVQRVKDAAANWPPTVWEKWAAHPVIRIGVPLVSAAAAFFRPFSR